MRTFLVGTALAVFAVSVTGCGESQPAGEAAEDTVGAGTTAETGPITVDGALGGVELAEPAERVVALEWTYAEDLVAVGVQPVGVADVEGYSQWVDAELDPSVTDVGTRQEPSLEAIAALDPDLIIGVQFRHEPILDQLEAIAPTVMFNPYPAVGDGPNQLEEMVTTFREVGEAVGRSEEAEQTLDEMQSTFDEVAAELAAADLGTTEFALAQGFTSEEVPTIRMFTDNAMAVGILEELGLQNAWPGEPEAYGFNTVDIEALTQVGDAHFLYVAQDEDNIFTGALADNPLWQDLAFVQADRVHPLGGDVWLFGGPLSAQLLAEDTASLLLDE